MKKSTNIKYVVNPDKKTVVCFLTGCKQDVLVDMSDKERNIMFDLRIDCTLKDKYIGIAKCAPADKFNEEYGRKLARKRMLVSYYMDRARVNAKIYNDLTSLANTFRYRSFTYDVAARNKREDIIKQLNNNEYIDKLLEDK